MNEPLKKLDNIEKKEQEEGKQPRGYVIFMDLRLSSKTNEKATYYIGQPMTNVRKECPFVFTLVRKHALIFKTRETIGKFLSMYCTELKNTATIGNCWNRKLYIQDVDNELLVVDSIPIDIM